jgi:hypothetical protein
LPKGAGLFGIDATFTEGDTILRKKGDDDACLVNRWRWFQQFDFAVAKDAFDGFEH